jgi:hypothetical protein
MERTMGGEDERLVPKENPSPSYPLTLITYLR